LHQSFLSNYSYYFNKGKENFWLLGIFPLFLHDHYCSKSMQNRILSLLLLLFTGLFVPASFVSAFTVVIDAGHGGKDTGTLGSIVREKDVVLAVGLKFGRLIKAQHSDVRVIYTRSTDVFIPLDQRAIMANNAKANLFISIHADHAETPSVKGASTFTLGQNRTRENLEIAKRENSVILLEENYKQRYEGFDPTVAESYIMFEFMQDNYMNQSIQFASILQQKFISSGRRDRGVRQDVFLVLRCTSMPSVLVELGFLSNAEEEQFLKSDEGQDRMAESLLRGFTDFKNDYERKTTGVLTSSKRTDTSRVKSQRLDSVQEEKSDEKQSDSISQDNISNQSTSESTNSDLIFKIQMATSSIKLSPSSKKFKGIQMDYFFENSLYKYTCGNYTSFEEANRKRREYKNSFPDAFVIAFKDGQKIPIEEARAQAKH